MNNRPLQKRTLFKYVLGGLALIIVAMWVISYYYPFEVAFIRQGRMDSGRQAYLRMLLVGQIDGDVYITYARRPVQFEPGAYSGAGDPWWQLKSASGPISLVTSEEPLFVKNAVLQPKSKRFIGVSYAQGEKAEFSVSGRWYCSVLLSYGWILIIGLSSLLLLRRRRKATAFPIH